MSETANAPRSASSAPARAPDPLLLRALGRRHGGGGAVPPAYRHATGRSDFGDSAGTARSASAAAACASWNVSLALLVAPPPVGGAAPTTHERSSLTFHRPAQMMHDVELRRSSTLLCRRKCAVREVKEESLGLEHGHRVAQRVASPHLRGQRDRVLAQRIHPDGAERAVVPHPVLTSESRERRPCGTARDPACASRSASARGRGVGRPVEAGAASR